MNKAQRLLHNIKSYFTGSRRIRLNGHGLPYFWPVGYKGGGYKYNEWNAEEFISNGYARNSYVGIVIDEIAEKASQLPTKFIDVEKGNEVPKTDRRVREYLAMLNRCDGQRQGFIYKSSAYKNATGEFFWRKITSEDEEGNSFVMPNLFAEEQTGNSNLLELEVLHVPDVTINTQSGYEWGIPKSYTYTNESSIPADEVVHGKYPNITKRTNRGLSPLCQLQPVYTGSNNAFDSRANLHENNAASGVLSQKSTEGAMPLQEDEQNRIQSSFDNRHQGAANFGKIILSRASLEFLRLGLAEDQLKTIESNEQNLRVIAPKFGLTSQYFGDPKSTSYNNMREAKKGAYEESFIPHLTGILDDLNTHILPLFGLEGVNEIVDTEKIEVLNPFSQLHTTVIADLNAGIITTNEARERLYPDLPPLQQSNEDND